jgi:PEP-CTERM motif
VAFPASAATIYIALQQAAVNGGAITTVASSGAATGPIYGPSAYGVFTVKDVNSLDTGTAGFPNLGSSVAVQLATAQAASDTITVWVTETGVTGGLPTNFVSALTSVTLSPGITATETTYYSAANAKFGGTQLFTSGFTTGGQAANGVNALTTTNPYSVTEEFVINVAAGKTGQSRLGEAITATSSIPEPSTWAMMALGFVGLGYAAFRRNARGRAVAI